MTKPKGSGRLIRRKAGGQLKHGAYSIVLRKELLEQFPEIGRYCRDTYEGILRDLCPDGSELPMAKRVLLDRLSSLLTTVSMIDTYIGRAGVLRADRPGVIEAHPILDVWLSINNQIRNTLQALGLERTKIEPLDATLAEIVEEYDRAAQPSIQAERNGQFAGRPGSAEDGQERAQDGRSQDASTDEQGSGEPGDDSGQVGGGA